MVRSHWNANGEAENGIPLRRGCTGKLPAKRLDTAICWGTAAWIAQHGRSTPAASPPQRYNTLDLANKVGVPKGAAAPFGILQ